mgnify:CR=1 FL=1
MKLPKKLKDNDQAKKYFNDSALSQIKDLWNKSYGRFLIAKNGKKYFISYEYAKGHNSHLKVQDFSWSKNEALNS